jgi:hypothetical protein
MVIIPEVDNVPYVSNAEFVKLIVTPEIGTPVTHTFSTSFRTETIDGVVYQALGTLLNIGTQQRDLRVTSSDTTITLSGLDSDNIYIVLGTKIKGSPIEIYRGFYDDNYNLVNTVRRFNGIITSYTITEDLQQDNNIDNFVISVNCSAYKTILENRIAGRKTNSNSWKEFNPTDISMDRVQAISEAYFDFGKPVSGSKAGVPATVVTTG